MAPEISMIGTHDASERMPCQIFKYVLTSNPQVRQRKVELDEVSVGAFLGKAHADPIADVSEASDFVRITRTRRQLWPHRII